MNDDLLDELANLMRPEYAGPAPLHYTSDYYTPEELVAAMTEVAHDPEAMIGPRHMWHYGLTTGWCGVAQGHRLCVLTCDLRCTCFLRYTVAQRGGLAPCQCVGGLVEQANCPDCEWHAIGSERDVVEAWHDHAWPGWRDLPVMPLKVRARGGGMNDKTAMDRRQAAKMRAWVEAAYPTEWQVEGAPVLTERETHLGSRHVPMYSPWMGFDLCARIVDREAVAA